MPCRSVHRHVRRARDAGHRREQDDAAAAPVAQPPAEAMCEIQVRPDVRLELVVALLDVAIEEPPMTEPAEVIADHEADVEVRRGRVERGTAERSVMSSPSVATAPSARLADAGGGRFDTGQIDVGEREIEAAGAQLAREAGADTAGSSRDEGNRSVATAELDHRRLLQSCRLNCSMISSALVKTAASGCRRGGRGGPASMPKRSRIAFATISPPAPRIVKNKLVIVETAAETAPDPVSPTRSRSPGTAAARH